MAKAINTFLKSKMNQDLDARLIPKGEYREAYNIQVSKSEGDGVGTVENVLGNYLVFDFESITGVNDLYCIGSLSDDNTNTVFVFLTDNDTNNYYPTGTKSNHYIFACNLTDLNSTPKLLVSGPFLNFSQQNPIYSSNLLEKLLFWTDNRNQPRKINIDLANPTGAFNSATYYTSEDQISVAKYNPYDCMELYQKSYLSTNADDYETTMKDVSSKYYPNGGAGDFLSSVSNTVVRLTSFEGDIQINGSTTYDSGAEVAYTNATTGEVTVITGATIDAATYDTAGSFWEITITGGVFPTLNIGQEIILNPNPYYNPSFSGDPDYLEDKFVRFSYRFRFDDNEYSIFAPFTQIAFIPKQDGYFMYVKENNLNLQTLDNQADAYRSTVVYFVENKVEDINLRIPLPFLNFELENSLKVKEIDILYKEAQQVAVKVVDTVSINDIRNSAGKVTVNGNVSGLTQFAIDNIQGGVNVGDFITGFGITGKPIVTAFDPTDPNNPSSGGNITLDIAQTLSDDTILNVNDPNYFVYNYQSKKPFKTLPEKDLTRVYDKIPVRAFSQEVAGNRIIYGNYQDKHTPPKSLNYNVAVSKKSDFDLKSTAAQVQGGPYTGTTITVKAGLTLPNVGDFMTLVTGSGIIPEGTQVVSVTASGGNYIIVLSESVTGLATSSIVFFEPGANTTQTTSLIEYPNSSLKQNRNYQVGIVLSDRYGRTSTVILSNNKDVIKVGPQSYSGSTVYSPYDGIDQDPSEWPGDSIKILFNEAITSFRNTNTGTPGLYNGDTTSSDYNPLGWYSWKVVVKQTEQEYYNVYLPGIMAAYPEDTTLEIGKTSHTALINDNINKVPRDLSELGPQQRQFRSSVQLFGRVENTANLIDPTNNLGDSNHQYYTGRLSDTVSMISTVNDLFEYNPNEAPRPNYFPQFYSVDSNPLIARISTESKIGQVATTNFNTVTANIAESATTDSFKLVDIAGDTATIVPGDLVLSNNFPKDIEVVQFLPGSSAGTANVVTGTPAGGANSFVVDAAPTGGVGNGTLVTATGIPAGTAITNITGTAPNITLTVSNNVNVTSGTTITYTTAPVLEVNQPQTVYIGQTITIIPDATPGIQYLAVYETKPEESLLDIFWETSSSGLISDLNDAVINDSSAGATLSDFNTNTFDEGLAQGANVLAAPFYILDNFGAIVPFADIDEDLELVGVSNDIEDITDLGYFSLVQTSGQNEFNIVTTAAYYNAIYYGEENSSSPSSLTTFELTFNAVINDQPLNVTRTIILDNVSPTIQSPADGTTYNITNNQENITTINCVNGANNTSFAPIFANGSCSITSQTNSNGDEVEYFDILDEPTIVSNVAQFQLINTQVGNVPVDRYELTICVQDAGGQNDQDCIDIVIDFGARVRNVKQFSYKRGFRRQAIGPQSLAGAYDYWYQSITIFEVFGGAASNAHGWYLYNGPWSNESSLQNLTTLNFSSEYGINNFPKNFVPGPSSVALGNPGIEAQVMLGPQQPPLLSALGGNGFVTIDFNTVNLPPLCENLRFSNISEADVLSLWNSSCDTFAYCSALFPGNVQQIGNYSNPSILPGQNNATNPAPNGFYGWNPSEGDQTEVAVGTFIIDENNYDVDQIAWQVNV